METLTEELLLRNYSPRTVEIYLHYNQHFLKLCNKRPQEVTQQDIRWYLGLLIRWKKSPATVNLAHNALLFYYTQVLRRRFYNIPFQKRQESIREPLTKEEVQALLNALPNKKHRLLISLLYATGVRVSEAIALRIEEFDLARKLLLVRSGKGGKDRYTILSDMVIKQIEEYLTLRTKQSPYLFETGAGHITARTVQEVLKKAAQQANIRKPVTPHVLRHSFATHLRDNKVQDSDIQKLLGHKNLKTTQGYARVSVEHLTRIQNPHDTLQTRPGSGTEQAQGL